MNPIPATFDIRNFAEKLKLVEGRKDRYHCPACGGNNLTIAPNTGKYQCWSGCNCSEIREALSPWSERVLRSKPIRPKSDKTWIYTDSQAEPIVQTRRIDNGNGGRRIWQEYFYQGRWNAKAPEGLKQEVKSKIVPYRYQEVLEAIAAGKPVFWVEGEPCADALWGIGIPAVTTICGSGGYGRGNYARLFNEADLVICPDQDETGLKYAESVAKDYPDARWLYAFPDSPVWQQVPKTGGVDIADWIAEGATAEVVLAAIEPTRRSFGEAFKSASKVTPIRADLPTALTLEQTSAAIKDLLAQNLKASDLQACKIELRSQTTVSERELNDLWQALSEEFEIEAEDLKSDLESQINLLLSAKETQIQLSQVLPPQIAQPLGQMATWQNLRPELYLVSLLTAIGSLAQNGTRLILHRGMDFEVTPNLFGAIVAESSQKKSPVLKTVIKKPMRTLFEFAKAEHEQAVEEWEAEKKASEAAGEEFKKPEPQLPLYYFTRATGESVLRQAQRVPHQGLLCLSDELAGYFKSANQYRRGSGSDLEDLLEYYDGSGGTVLRTAGLRDDVSVLNFGVMGAIQPKVLQKFLGNCEDANGNWARFFFVQQPTVASTLPEDDPDFDLVKQLEGLYFTINHYAPQEYGLTAGGFRYFQKCYNTLEIRREREPNPALRAVIGKTAGRIGKIALCLHLLEAAARGEANPAPQIGVKTLEKAATIAKLAIDQIRALYGEFDGDSVSGLAAKIIEMSRRVGQVTARKVQQTLSKGNQSDPASIRQAFLKLEADGWGTTEGSGNRLTFTAYPKNKTVGSVGGQPTVLPTVETPDTMEFQQTVGSVDAVGDFSDFQPESVAEKPQQQAVGSVGGQPTVLPTVDIPIERELQQTVGAVGAVANSRKTKPHLKVGDRVGKKGKVGWAGEIQSIQGEDADVLWNLDKYPSSVRLTELELKVDAGQTG